MLDVKFCHVTSETTDVKWKAYNTDNSPKEVNTGGCDHNDLPLLAPLSCGPDASTLYEPDNCSQRIESKTGYFAFLLIK